MATYQSRLNGREEVAEGTMAFHLEKPAGFQFKAGQYVDVSLINPPETDSEGIIRSFSIASAPYEDQLLVVTRMRKSAFKRVLAILPLGTEVKLEGPMGSFTLHKNRVKAGVFPGGRNWHHTFFVNVAPGCRGKTPSAALSLLFQPAPQGCRISQGFGDSLQIEYEFHFHSFDERDGEIAAWLVERGGFIDREMLLRHMDSLKGPIYYVAGPPAMVVAMREMLTKAGVEEDDIRTEEFGGY